MQPIPTKYQDVKFRSRLEARWAVFFDAMDYDWHYESKTIPLVRHGLYTPDFWIGDGGVFAEVKPVEPTALEILKAKAACDYCQGVLLLIGAPEFRGYWMLSKEGGRPQELLVKLDGIFPLACAPMDREPGYLEFSDTYGRAVEKAKRFKFDGFDNDRETIQRRYL